MQKTLVIGGGPAGLACARRLAGRGKPVLLVEAGPDLGGHPRFYNCKAGERCRKCGACLVAEDAWRVRTDPAVQVCLESVVTGLEADLNGWQAQLQTPAGRLQYRADSLVLATGFATIAPDIRPEFGYGRYPKVITALELEQRLRRSEEWDGLLGVLPRIAVIQCYGSRSQRGGVPYCSRVCCLYAEKLGHLLVENITGATVDLFYMDRQSYPPVYAAGETGSLRYIRGIPSRVEGRPGGVLRIPHEEVLKSNLIQATYDWAVLCPAIVPNPETAGLYEALGVELDERGFVKTFAGNVTSRDGVYAAGTCLGPQTILESQSSGRAAADLILERSGIQLFQNAVED
jgi:heterodisulfide reductase subunit A